MPVAGCLRRFPAIAIMDISVILENLKAQRDRVLECIVALERLEAQKPRRGRPPNWIASARSVALESGSSPSLPDGAPSGEVPQPVARKRGRPPAKHR